jgi:hypothetical protein
MENSGNQEFLDMFLCHNLYTKSMTIISAGSVWVSESISKHLFD